MTYRSVAVSGTTNVTKLGAVSGEVIVHGERELDLQELSVLVPLHRAVELETRADCVECHVLLHLTVLAKFVVELNAHTQRT